jgi:cell wall assembly regulator SMI1
MPTEADTLTAAYSDFRLAVAETFPDLLPELRPPVPVELPYASRPGSEQLMTLWRLTSGQPNGRDGPLGIAGGLRLLGPRESEAERTSWSKLITQGSGWDAVAHPAGDQSRSLDPEAVRAVYFANGWVPVLAEPYEANYLAVDLVPLPAGRAGQVILCGRDEDDKVVVAPDLATIFHALASECRNQAWSLMSEEEDGATSKSIDRNAGRLLTACKMRRFP